jgi:hypothetical protein
MDLRYHRNICQIIYKLFTNFRKKCRHQRKRRTECRAPSLTCGSMRPLVSCACARRRQPTWDWEYMPIQSYASRRAAILACEHRSSRPTAASVNELRHRHFRIRASVSIQRRSMAPVPNCQPSRRQASESRRRLARHAYVLKIVQTHIFRHAYMRRC